MKRSQRNNQISEIGEIINLIPDFTRKTTAQEIRERITGKDHDLLIAEDKGQSVGFIIAYALDKRTYYNWIMGVLPEFRDKGYGRQLIELFESIAIQKGYTEVKVKTTEKFLAMRHLLATLKYQETGFDEEGKIILRKNL